MLIKGERLRKISDNVFQEIDPPKDRHRPLEWRRGFHPLDFSLTNIQIVQGVSVNDVNYFGESELESFPQVSPNPKTIRCIEATISDCRDTIKTIKRASIPLWVLAVTLVPQGYDHGRRHNECAIRKCRADG